MDDWRLLRRYLDESSETAFGQLVERHKKLVYWTCRREVADAQLAEDAAQAVFIVLARKAATIRKDASLAGWLFSVARHVAKDARASDLRRRKNEEKAARLMQSETNSDAVWEQVEPWLNDALSSLPGTDRNAVLLRYAEGCSFPEIASTLGTTEEAARKRVARSLDRLRRFLNKKDVPIAAGVLGAVLLERSASAVPETFAAVNGHAILTAASGHAHTALLTKGAHLAMEATKKKIIITAMAGAIAALGVTAGVMRERTPSFAFKGSHFTDAVIAFGESPEEASARAAIDAGYKQLLRIQVENDIPAMAAMTDETFLDVVPKGIAPQTVTTNKAQWLDMLAHQNLRLLARETFDCTLKSISVKGDRATVHILAKAHYNLGKQRQLDDIHLDEDHWVRRNGTWMWAGGTVLTDQDYLNGKPTP